MLYEQCIEQIEELKNKLNFQERRNFFNKIEDKHLNASIDVINSILDKSHECEFSYEDLAEVISISVQIISILDISEEINSHLNKMLLSVDKLKKQSLKLKE